MVPDLFGIGYNKLNETQRSILKECEERCSFGLSLPMGSGKTILALMLSLKEIEKDGLALIVASKSLIPSWEDEIKKFFKKDLKYEVFHQSSVKLADWKPKKKTKIVLTTPEVISKCYKENQIRSKYITQRYIPKSGIYTNVYDIVTHPYLASGIGTRFLYSTKWKCLIIDEAQTYTNIETIRSQGIASIASEKRILLSGTLFDEPNNKKILGFFMLLNEPNVPHNILDFQPYIESENFRGLNQYVVKREKNVEFKEPKVNKEIVYHEMKDEERKIYMSMKQILNFVSKKAKSAKLLQDKSDLKIFTAYKLVMVMYLRQVLICPLLPITNICIDVSDTKNKSELSDIILDQIRNLNIRDYLEDINSVKSSRIDAVLSKINKHEKEKIVVFSCFKTALDILNNFIPEERSVFIIKSTMSMQKRADMINEFRDSDDGVLLMTYDIGSTGLNLQCATTVMLVDFWWNAAKTQQAIARILRYGQLADEINIYFFASNTGIEKIILEKQHAKNKIIDELMVGSVKSTVPRIQLDDIIKMINQNENTDLIHINY